MDLDQLVELLLQLKAKATDNGVEIRINGKEINRIKYLYSQDSNQIYEEFIDIVID